MNTLWIAIVLMVPHIYDTPQKACEATTPGLIVSKKLVYKLTTSETVNDCCADAVAWMTADDDASIFAEAMDCHAYPTKWGCYPLNKARVETFECIASPSYEVKERTSKEKPE